MTPETRADALKRLNDKVELKACPFCGGESEYAQGFGRNYVQCKNGQCWMQCVMASPIEWETRPKHESDMLALLNKQEEIINMLRHALKQTEASEGFVMRLQADALTLSDANLPWRGE